MTRTTSDAKVTITHRIVAKNTDSGQTMFDAKGDANNSADGENFGRDSIIGKVFFVLPFIGYPIGFARTMPGFILLVIVPAVVIVYEEILSIKAEFIKAWKKRKGNDEDITGDYFTEEKYIRQNSDAIIGQITFDTKASAVVNEKVVRRKMDL